MSDDWLTEDPFADADDPAAREREQRRREREEKRAKKAGKKAEAEQQAPPPPPPPPEEPVAPPPPPRTPEEEFWDEEPEVAAAPAEPARREEPATPPPPPAPAVSGNGRPPAPKRGGGFLAAIGRHPFRLFAAIAALFALWFLNELFQPFHGDGSGKVQVTIPKGSSVSEVGDLLAEEDVIDNSTLFQVRVTLAGKRSEIYSGNFTLAENMSYGAAIDALSVPPVKRTVTVTIPEGYTRSQAAQVAEEAGVPGDYTKATIKSKYLDPAEYGGKDAKDLEGFLFPDTFELKPNAPVTDLVQLQLQDFRRRIKGVDMEYAKSKNLTVFDVVTIASMVEDEAGVDSQRGLVASVIYNRLHEGMPLGIDATIRFATGNYTEPLTESELAIDSPYNSRTNVGLPPGPISNPGLASIEAAAHPPKTEYLFYVTTPGACGKLTFAKTEAEFEAAVDKYNSAREAAGGNSPDSCGE
ncbi:MAG TPA: endolytic transglycosylase MltG [Solirubrobacterales bacterium]|nr:endolytic transglycosylase MltG [Solirubrobacterales bacterium]